jgi:hypothetical protein
MAHNWLSYDYVLRIGAQVTSHDPLARLIVDQAQANRELLAKTLDGVIGVDPTAKKLVFAPHVRARFTARAVVVATLLGRKALSLLADSFVEGAAPKELEEELGIAGGTLRPVVKRLADDGLVVRSGRTYRIPNHLIEEAGRELQQGS